MQTVEDHAAICSRLSHEVSEACAAHARVGLRKNTSNLFRRRNGAERRGLDVRGLNHVLGVDVEQRLADVEGMVTYEDFVEATLPYGLLPAVVPQLKTITVGGAVSGLGIESSSARFGLVHETIDSMELLLGDGRIVRCSRGENADLFFGFPNSYGTLGYAVRLTARLMPARPYVHLRHTQFSDAEAFLERMAGSDADFVDGTVFARDRLYLTEARFADQAPRTSDYTFRNIYYQSIERLPEDWLTARDYIWRWDTDWFWCSKQFHLDNGALRWLARPWLNSRSYQKWMRAAQRWWPDRGKTESVIQDVQIPIGQAEAFFDFLMREVAITPVWICPFRTFGDRWTLTSLERRELYVNFGFWDVVAAQGAPGFLNRKIERKARELGGTKALYSSSYYDEGEFWEIYDRPAYGALKQRADPHGVLRDLYQTAVVQAR